MSTASIAGRVGDGGVSESVLPGARGDNARSSSQAPTITIYLDFVESHVILAIALANWRYYPDV
ncbi:hypothetical protein CVT25_009395 [Psilocybe cyanescens]|uniref:Uncharacterized protein n=1 Tax=Psilocybe cyanescens TaxID=93625 RepID=A0A409XV15_PSICY|nr:hypothetical protein CVT25_009395 [Psilocybe cyanescens]